MPATVLQNHEMVEESHEMVEGRVTDSHTPVVGLEVHKSQGHNRTWSCHMRIHHTAFLQKQCQSQSNSHEYPFTILADQHSSPSHSP